MSRNRINFCFRTTIAVCRQSRKTFCQPPTEEKRSSNKNFVEKYIIEQHYWAAYRKYKRHNEQCESFRSKRESFPTCWKLKNETFECQVKATQPFFCFYVENGESKSCHLTSGGLFNFFGRVKSLNLQFSTKLFPSFYIPKSFVHLKIVTRKTFSFRWLKLFPTVPSPSVQRKWSSFFPSLWWQKKY